ncbi:sulfite oxidase, mitochondrial, partial [Nilaparvata lugens]|uniref:sulfite oxidase, mitochondrial n=1 Tax=Nilaparvata lugens TaxID=108931 RepID=UPI00193D7A2C
LFAASQKSKEVKAGEPIPGLPLYSLKDVSQHCSKKDEIWVTYKQGVYNITAFIDAHPGGDKIMMAAGGSVEPFWLMYGVHKQPEILEMLEKYRIGNLSMEESLESTRDMEDPYGLEPKRHPSLKINSHKPFNAEPPPSLLADSFITPVELFYVRNHLPVPVVDVSAWRLTIEGVGFKSIELSMDQIKKFPKHTVTTSIQCAGNRRSEMSKIKKVKGLDWGTAAIGNATFSGARLYDVLRAAGLKEDEIKAQHVQFEGLDTDPANVPYAASIPIEKAMDPRGDVLLAYEMNGAPLSRDHGFPLRAVVPGVAGARNVKWLGAIYVSEEESSSHWQQNDYKGFSPSTDWDTVDFTKSPAIQQLPVTSAICEPSENEEVAVKNGKITVKGYASSGGGNKIVRVDVTADCGQTWHVAELINPENNKPPHHWAWSLWQVDIPVSKGQKQMELWVKAVDSSYNTQPESFKNIWNLRGVLSNAYHRINIKLKH